MHLVSIGRTGEIRISTVALVAGAGACVLTAAVALVPFVELAYRAPELDAALETAATLTAGLAAYLFLGRFEQEWDLPDILLVSGLALFAGSNLFFSAIPAIAGNTGGRFATWSAVAAILAGAALFAASSVAPRRRLRHPSRAAALALLGCAVGLGLIAAVAGLLAQDLPRAVDPGVSPMDIDLLTGNAAILALQGVIMVLFAVAAVGFARRAASTGDELTGWLAVGAALSAAARLNYLLFPSLYSEWVTLGDAFRLLFYLSLLVGVLREIRGYQQRLARAALLDERRRMARELHDGLAQELAFISMHSRRLAKGFDPKVMDRLCAAADRALDESRGAISSLTLPLDEPFDSIIAQAAQEVARRYGARVNLELDPSVEMPLKAREAMRRIVREAVGNAVRHGKARTVTVEVTNRDSACRMRVVDDGTGFDQDDSAREAGEFGLVSIRDRAESVGARLEIKSRPGAGTAVEVVLP